MICVRGLALVPLALLIASGACGGDTTRNTGSTSDSGAPLPDPCTAAATRNFAGDAGGECKPSPVDTNTDPTNCGARNHVCAPIVMASAQASPVAIGIDSTHLYWANAGTYTFEGCQATGARPGCSPTLTHNLDGALMKMPLAGGAPTVLASGLPRPSAIALDPSYVYLSDDSRVMKVPIGGGMLTVLAAFQGLPWSIAVNTTNVYWANHEEATLLTVPIDGGTPVVIASNQESSPKIAVDATSIYWATAGLNGGVLKMALTGGTPIRLATHQSQPWQIALDAANLYWTQLAVGMIGNEVRMVSLCSGAMTTLVTGQQRPGAIAAGATGVYWTDVDPTISDQPEPSGNVIKKPFGCGAPITLASGQAYPIALAVNAIGVYWANGGTEQWISLSTPVGTISPADGSIMRLGVCTDGVCE